MAQDELISIIVPIYNVEKFLPRCIQSILSQTYSNIELILVDDGSPDRSAEICDSFARQDLRVKVIHKENGGSADARNAGVDAATGKYTIFVDGDDFIAPTMLEKLYHSLQANQADMAMCSFQCVSEDCFDVSVVSENTYIEKDEVITEQEFWRNYFAHPGVLQVVIWNKLVQTERYRSARFIKGKKIDDEFVIHKVVTGCERIACISENLYYYRKRNESAMASRFSIGHLDVAEARLERASFFKERGFQYYAEKSVTFAYAALVEGQQKLSLTEDNARKRLSELQKHGKVVGRNVAKGRSSLRFKMSVMIFLLSPRLYGLLANHQTNRK